MVDVLNPKDENEHAEDRGLAKVGPQSTSSSAPQLSKQPKESSSSVQQPITSSQGTANQQQSPIPESQVPTGQGEDFIEFVPQPAPLQFEQVPQPGYRGDLINSINPEAEIQEELLQKQAQNTQDTFNLGLLGIQAAPERPVDSFDWREGRPIDEIRETLDVPHYAGLNGSGLNFLDGSGEVSQRSDSSSSDLAIASKGTTSELADTLQKQYDPERKFNTSRGLLSFFSLPIRALTNVDLGYLASKDFYNNEATESERALIDKYGAENAAPLLFPNKVLERLDRQYAESLTRSSAEKPKQIEPAELNFNIWEGKFGDFGNAGLLSGAAYLLSLPENIVMAAAGELVEQFNENIPGRERNRFLDVLAGRDLGIFEERTSDYKIFSLVPPQDLDHGVSVSEYEEATGRTIPPILQALWDNPEFIQEEYGVSKELARLPMYAVLGAAFIGSASIDDLFWKPLKAAGRVSGLAGDIAEEAVMRELRRLRRVGLSPDAPDFTPQAAEAITRVAEIPDTRLLPPAATDAPTKEMVADYIGQKFGTEYVPPILFEDDIGRFQVLEWRDKTVPERIIKVTDTTEPKSSLDLYVRKVMEERPVGGALSPIVESRGKLVVRSSDAATETVVLLDKTEAPRLDPFDPSLDPWDTRKSVVDMKDELAELQTATANTSNLTRVAEIEQDLTVAAKSGDEAIQALEDADVVFKQKVLATGTPAVEGIGDPLAIVPHTDKEAVATGFDESVVDKILTENGFTPNKYTPGQKLTLAQEIALGDAENAKRYVFFDSSDDIKRLRNESRAETGAPNFDLEISSVVKAEDLSPPSRPTEVLKELERNPQHRVATKDVTTVRRTNSELTWVGKNTINPDTGKPFVNPNRSTPLSTAQIDRLYKDYGDLFARHGAPVNPTLSVATHVEIAPNNIRRLRRAEEVIQPPRIDAEAIKKPTLNDYNRQLGVNKKKVAQATTPEEYIKEKQLAHKLLDRLEASMDPSELFKAKVLNELPIRLSRDVSNGEKLVDLQRDAKTIRSDIVRLTEELQGVKAILDKSTTDLDSFRRYNRGDIGSDYATKQLHSGDVQPLFTNPDLPEELPEVSSFPKVSEDAVVFFGVSSPQDIRAMSIDEVEVGDLGLGLVGFRERLDIAESYSLRSRPVNAIPMGTAPPKVYAVNTSRLNLLDGSVPDNAAKDSLVAAISENVTGAVNQELLADLANKPFGQVLSEIKSRLIDLYGISELEYRNIIDDFQSVISNTYDGIKYQDVYTVWAPEKLNKLEVKSLPEPEYNVAKLADYTVDSFMDGKLNTPTSTANRLQSYRDLAQAQYDDIAEQLADTTKRQVELNRDIINTELELKQINRNRTRKRLETLETQVNSDFRNAEQFMKPDYQDPC